MEPFGSERKDTRSTVQQENISGTPSRALFDLPTSTPNTSSASESDPLLHTLGSVLTPGLGFNDYSNQVLSPPLNYGFNLNSIGTSEQFTEQELAELDAYLNSLSQAGGSESAGIPPCFSNGTPFGSFEYPDNFSQAASSGRHLYEEVLNQWSPAYGTPPQAQQPTPSKEPTQVYSPFGSGAFAYDQTNVAAHDTQPEKRPEPKTIKPSFAEVAKNKPAKSVEKTHVQRQSSHNEKPEQSGSANCTVHSVTNKVKKLKRPGSVKNKYVPVTPTEIKPDSRYGLDTFDDTGVEKENKTINSRETSRKNSTSSISSTMSGEDKEPMPPESGRHGQNPTIGGRKTNIRTRVDSGEKVFFDPRRIFQDSQSKSHVETNNEDFVPNNKQKIQADKDKDKVKASVKTGSTKYINNDLRDTKKHNNVEHDHVSNHVESHGHRRQAQERDGARSRPKKNEASTNVNGVRERANRRDWENDRTRYVLGEWIWFGLQWLKWLLKELGVFLWNLATLVLSVFLLLMALVLHYALAFELKLWSFVKEKIPFLNKNEARFNWSKDLGSQHRQKQLGLKENITLPSTGDEAMRRLLSCKGKDPYSILGVRGDASDDDIKKYYRKQAFLVHPDKNKQPGAEESFKILGHAFDLIGTPEKRKDYDSQYDKTEAEAAMQEFADLLSKLNEKMQEAANLLRCDQCGGKHKRVPTDRPMYCARFCDRCNTRHPAKEGDVWAESTMLGFLWHYYACMEGKVFDITEWAKCKRENFKSLQANAHQVIYRLTTTGGRPRHSAARTGEADLEDFLNNLFHHTTSSMPGDPNATQTRAPPQNNAGAKKGRKKKKKH